MASVKKHCVAIDITDRGLWFVSSVMFTWEDDCLYYTKAKFEKRKKDGIKK